MTTPIPERMLTYAEAAAYLRRSVSWVEKQMRKNHLPFHKEGKNVRFRMSELIAWLEENNIDYDNRIVPVRPLKKHGGTQTVYPNHTLGDLDHCWCGEPIDHNWEGKEHGAPHPHEHEGMQQVVVVQEGFTNEPPHIDRKALRGYHGDLRDFLVQCINVDRLRYRITPNETILYPLDDSRPISVYARNTNQQLRSLKQWYAAHVQQPALHPEPDLGAAIRELATHVNDPVTHPVKEQEPPEPVEEWTTYLDTNGEPNEMYETNGTVVRCRKCVGTDSHYETPVSDLRGLGGHIRMNHRDTENLRSDEAKEKSVYVRRYNRLEQQVLQAVLILGSSVGYKPPDQTEVENLRAEVTRLTKENDDLKTRIALIEEAFRGTQ